MDLRLPDHLNALTATVRDFCERNVRPHAATWDREERFPSEVVKGLGALGILGIRVPEDFGGAGLGTLAVALVVEEIAKFDGSLALTVASHNGLGSSHIRVCGNDAQRRRYLPKLASGEWLGAWALTEPGSGSDSAAMRTTAVRDGSDWVINGSKAFITQGSVGNVVVVLAATDRSKGKRGISAFIVEFGTAGLSAAPMHGKMGMRSSDTAILTFDNVRVPDAQRVGNEGEGFIDTMKILDGGRITIAALALGLGQGALDTASNYCKERQAFGRRIGDFQAIRWMLADMETSLQASRLLVYRAADLADRGLPHTAEASYAKLFASEAGTKACNQAVQILGGYGYTNAFPVERALRDAKLCEIGEGTSEVQRMVISKLLLRA